MKNYHWLRLIFKTNDSSATILIRTLVSIVFVSEGMRKLIFSGMMGSDRYTSMNIPDANIFGPFVGVIEITCGLLILLGLITRLASIPLIITMLVTILSTAMPFLLGENWWIFHVQELSHYSFWSIMHEVRANVAALFAVLYLLIRGAGKCSLDAWIYEVCSVKRHKITSER